MRYLVTGHTGFKGTWLIRMLADQGHQVDGLSLDPLANSLFEGARGERFLSNDFRGDISDPTITTEAIQASKPDVIVHLAAQALVLPSYEDPGRTLRSNVVGTANVLEAANQVDSVGIVVVVTTDKVYANNGSGRPFVETDPLGGHDPYSTSKAMCDLWAQSWARTTEGPRILIARAGNVIGYGDTSRHRLVPDLLRSWRAGQPVLLRNADAVRPWQHVSDCLRGYLSLVEHAAVLESGSSWNFAPDLQDHIAVRQLVTLAAGNFGAEARWAEESNEGPHEEQVLVLDSTKARTLLGWSPEYSVEDAVRQAVSGTW